MILFSNPADAEERVRLTVRASFDDGQTWPSQRVIVPDRCEYSCLAVLPDGDIGLLFKGDRRIKFTKFSGIGFQPVVSKQNQRQAVGQSLITVGVQKQLMVDDYTIAEQHNITRVLGKPKKLGIVMRPSVPTDFDPSDTFPNGLPESGRYYEFGRRLSVLWNE